ncbi:MAG: hypothetical protein NVS9B10_06430 [Nevskia sp.]
MQQRLKKLCVGLAAALLAACSDDSSGLLTAAGPAPPPGPPPTAACASPTPAQAIDRSVVVNIPSDSDRAATVPPTTITPTSTIAFSILLPKRCPGDQFPLILQSHGYGGNRINKLAADGTLKPADAHFPSINELVAALPFHDYVVISYDERGHGDSHAANARIIDPEAEVLDARHILDWAYDNAATYNIQTLPNSGIPKDLNVGTIGLSYGGGFQLTLSALDPRIKTIVPNGTWNDLLYSLLPGDAVKLSFDGLLCVLSATATNSAGAPQPVANTPVVAALCNAVGPSSPSASMIRTRTDLVTAVGRPTTLPRPITAPEVDPFFYTHSIRYFETQQAAGQSWGFAQAGYAPTPSRLRPVPALFLQGNRDTLFNLTEAYRSLSYFGATGADVRLLSTEGGHMNPLASQTEGTANCGKVIGVASILAWFDSKLKGLGSATYSAIPKICISVADTVGAPAVTPVGLLLSSFPVGSLSGTGAVPATMATLTGTVAVTDANPVFVPVITISGSGRVLAGAPRIHDLTVIAGAGAPPGQIPVAHVGVGILRAGSTTPILVDDEITGFVGPGGHDATDTGIHTNNRGVNNSDGVLLPALGERLQNGDRVGLLFYQQQVQYSAVSSGTGVTNAPNPYTVTANGVELPILIPGTYPGSSLSQ